MCIMVVVFTGLNLWSPRVATIAFILIIVPLKHAVMSQEERKWLSVKEALDC